MKNLPLDVSSAIEALKGGKGSGNWGHGGLPGVHGGSSSGGFGKGDNLTGAGAINRIKKYANGMSDERRGEKTPRDVTGYGDWADKDMKDHVVQTISDKTKLKYQDVNDAVRAWAETSNKTYDAFLTQRAATEVFGVRLSDWQTEDSPIKEHLLEQNLETAVQNVANDLLLALRDARPTPDGWNPDTDEWEQDEVLEQFLDDYFNDPQNAKKIDSYLRGDLSRAEIDWEYGSGGVVYIYGEVKPRYYSGHTGDPITIQWEIPLDPTDTDVFLEGVNDYLSGETVILRSGIRYQSKMDYNNRQFRYESRKLMLREIYDQTQSVLKDLFPGKKTITLYRGISDFDPDLHYYSFNALESWSLSTATATMFAQNSAHIARITVPIEKIFSTPLSGMGCLREMEFIVIGGNYKVDFLDDWGGELDLF